MICPPPLFQRRLKFLYFAKKNFVSFFVTSWAGRTVFRVRSTGIVLSNQQLHSPWSGIVLKFYSPIRIPWCSATILRLLAARWGSRRGVLPKHWPLIHVSPTRNRDWSSCYRPGQTLAGILSDSPSLKSNVKNILWPRSLVLTPTVSPCWDFASGLHDVDCWLASWCLALYCDWSAGITWTSDWIFLRHLIQTAYELAFSWSRECLKCNLIR